LLDFEGRPQTTCRRNRELGADLRCDRSSSSDPFEVIPMWTWLRVTAARIRTFFSGRKLDRDFEQELESHLLMLTGENIRRGMTPAEAAREACVRLGGVASLQESHREVRGLPFLDTLRQDLRYTFRGLRKNPAFTTFAILIVGLGIGASSTIFSVVNTLL